MQQLLWTPCPLSVCSITAGGGAVELQLQKNVQEVHVNSNADPSLGGVASAGGSHATEPAVDAGAISCRIDPAVSTVLATCCEDLNVDTALPFEVRPRLHRCAAAAIVSFGR